MIAATIILVDDHPVFRQGLYHLLRKEKDFKVIGEAGDGEVAVEMVRRDKPDVVIMDINMPNLDGIEATRRIVSEHPKTRVVALSVHSGKQFVRDMFQAGAVGYLLKESVPEEMIEGIRTILSGDVYLSKTISNILVSDYKTLIPEPDVSSSIVTSSLLYTKLHRTPITARIIPRTRLVEFMESGTQNPMTLVAAPAGYGKSILASQWMEVSGLPSGWVSLDEGDNDFRIFLSYFLEAILTVFPEQVLKTKAVITATRLPSVKEISHSLLNDLEALPKRCILVLDDYHYINNASVNNFIAELLIHPSPSIHLALITRRDPALPLTTLRARGMLTEITLEHLRFTVPETKLFMERFLHISVTDKTATVLEDKVEGWVTGLHLAALSIRSDADQDRLTDGLEHSSQYVRDYLIQEALSKAPIPSF
jgi:DNA-binding NarL/FixJ family response regulator